MDDDDDLMLNFVSVPKPVPQKRAPPQQQQRGAAQQARGAAPQRGGAPQQRPGVAKPGALAAGAGDAKGRQPGAKQAQRGPPPGRPAQQRSAQAPGDRAASGARPGSRPPADAGASAAVDRQPPKRPGPQGGADVGAPRKRSKGLIRFDAPQAPQGQAAGLETEDPASSGVFSEADFGSMGLDERMVKNLAEDLKITRTTRVQQAALPAMLAGRDVLLKSETGSGKTVGYCIALVHSLARIRPPIRREDGTYALVLAPTRELCAQILLTLTTLVKSCIHVVPGSIMGGEKKKSEKSRLRKGVSILVATPGRLLDHLNTTASFTYSNLRWLILDEADRLLDMGFEKDVRAIVHKLNEHAVASGTRRQSALVSATLKGGVERLASLSLRDPVRVGFDRPPAAPPAEKAHEEDDPSSSSEGSDRNEEDGAEEAAAPHKRGDDDDAEAGPPPPALRCSRGAVPHPRPPAAAVPDGARQAAARRPRGPPPLEDGPARRAPRGRGRAQEQGGRRPPSPAAPDSGRSSCSSARATRSSSTTRCCRASACRPRATGSRARRASGSARTSRLDLERAQGHGQAPPPEQEEEGVGGQEAAGRRGKKAGKKRRKGVPDSSDEEESGSGSEEGSASGSGGSDEEEEEGDDEEGSSGEEAKRPAPGGAKKKGKRRAKGKPAAAAAGTAPLVGCKLFKLHGSMGQLDRVRTFLDFCRTSAAVLLCTDVAARGLDLPHVRTIVQYDTPGEVKEYVHRVGRTARAGRSGEALLFLLPSEEGYAELLAGAGVRIRPLKLSTVLGTLSASGERQRGARPKAERNALAAVALQHRLERLVGDERELHRMATAAYRSFLRAYTTHTAATRHIFSVKSLHLGHLAKSFALKDAPSAITKAGRKERRQEKKEGRKVFKKGGSRGARGERSKPYRIVNGKRVLTRGPGTVGPGNRERRQPAGFVPGKRKLMAVQRDEFAGSIGPGAASRRQAPQVAPRIMGF